MLDSSQVRQFMEDGFVKVEGAFSRDVADACVEILWRDTGCDRHDPATWTKPVIRLGDYGQEPFRLAANTPALHEAFDQLVGAGRWAPRSSLGTFPIRFPSDEDPGDAGWHTDASFYGADQSPRLNLMSHGRALLMLFLFSPVGVDDAPMRIRVGSHLDIPPLLAPAGEAGLSVFELAERFDVTAERPLTMSTGHVHAAQPHHGSTPRIMAQPPLYPAEPLSLNRVDGDYSLVELAIRRGLA